MLVRRGLCRMAVAAAEVLTWASPAAAQANQPLLECLVAGSQCRDRPSAAICIEGIVPLIYDLRFTECRELPPMLAQALLAPVLLHAEYINEDAEFDDEDVADVYLDEEEWSRVSDIIFHAFRDLWSKFLPKSGQFDPVYKHIVCCASRCAA